MTYNYNFYHSNSIRFINWYEIYDAKSQYQRGVADFDVVESNFGLYRDGEFELEAKGSNPGLLASYIAGY